MVEAINSNYNSSDFFSKTKPVDMMGTQTNRQGVAEQPELQPKKNQTDTVTISNEALNAQRSNTAVNNPEEARKKSMEEAQKMASAGTGASKNNPLETIAQTYGVSK
jgi:hypothetical protein